MRRFCSIVAATLLLAALAGAPVSAAPEKAPAWKISLAMHCDECGWWVARAVQIRLYADGTGIYEFSNIGAPSATHQKWTFEWTTGDGVYGPNSLFQTNVTIETVDTGEVVFIPGPRDTGVTLVPGHYDARYLWAIPNGGGMSASLQVIQMPGAD